MPYSRSYGRQTHPGGGGVKERAGLLQETLGRRTGGRHRKEQKEGRKEGGKKGDRPVDVGKLEEQARPALDPRTGYGSGYGDGGRLWDGRQAEAGGNG